MNNDIGRSIDSGGMKFLSDALKDDKLFALLYKFLKDPKIKEALAAALIREGGLVQKNPENFSTKPSKNPV